MNDMADTGVVGAGAVSSAAMLHPGFPSLHQPPRCNAMSGHRMCALLSQSLFSISCVQENSIV